MAEELYPDAKKLVLVTDNLNTHTPACLYEAFGPARARRIAERLEWHYTPKHESWLNTAEIEFAALSKQCLDRRIGSLARLRKEVGAWEEDRADGRSEVAIHHSRRSHPAPIPRSGDQRVTPAPPVLAPLRV